MSGVLSAWGWANDRYFLTRLPGPFLPLHDSDFKRLAKLNVAARVNTRDIFPGLSVFAKAGNRMGTARRCELARLFFTLEQDPSVYSNTVYLAVAQILIRVSESIIASLTHLNLPTKSTDLLTHPHFVLHFSFAIHRAHEILEESSENPFPLILPDDYIEELKRARLLK